MKVTMYSFSLPFDNIHCTRRTKQCPFTQNLCCYCLRGKMIMKCVNTSARTKYKLHYLHNNTIKQTLYKARSFIELPINLVTVSVASLKV